MIKDTNKKKRIETHTGHVILSSGILDGEIRKIENRTRQHIEYHFCLRNHTHWDWNDEILPDMLKCVFYTTSENFAAILPMETNIW